MERLKSIIKNYKIILLILFYLIITRGKCLVRELTGVPCPGCGITRAYIALAKGDVKLAWHYHPLFWFIGPLIIFLLIFQNRLLNKKKAQLIIGIVSFILILGVYIFRMVTLFPNNPPMEFNRYSIIYRIYHHFVI